MARRVAIVAADAVRGRLAGLLGDAVTVVDAALAGVLLVDVPEPRAIVTALEDARGVPAIAMVDAPDGDIAATALRAGAAGVVARQSDLPELLAAIDAVAAGLLVVDGSARESLVGSALHASGADGEPLTPRERDVLMLLARGLSNKRIAARLNVSEHTVKFHVGSVLGKLGAATRAEAVALGARRGYVIV
jgi:DNA-binding NarL/FixJ family response regulator